MNSVQSQCARVLAHLKKFGKITQIQASAMFIMRLAARIFELRQQGVEIICRMVSATATGDARVAEYSLKREAP